MKLLCDFHHEDLYNSLSLLFEKRMGWQIFRPIGTEWWKQGYWRVFDHAATAQQFLGLHQGKAFDQLKLEQPNGGHRWLNDGLKEVAAGLYEIPDANYGTKTYGVTLEAFKKMKFDIIVSSMLVHFETFERLRKQFQPSAHHVFQSGNNWSCPPGVKNYLNSTTMPAPAGVNHVFYHQEFDLDIFKPSDVIPPKRICNLMHYAKSHYQNDFFELERLMPDWEFIEYGAGNRDGGVGPGQVAETIRNSAFIWHCKRGGDGYGFNIMHSFACGKPMIVRGNQNTGKTAGPLFIDNHTVIDLDRCTLPEAAAKLRVAYDDYLAWTTSVRRIFKQVVDFEAEFEQIKLFLGRLQ